MNSVIVKIGDIYYRQNLNISKKDEKTIKRNDDNSPNSNNNLEKCEIEMKNNPQYVIEYARDIFEFLQKTEKINTPSIGYFNGFQKQITEKMRAILVDWLIDVHNKFSLLPETLYLTINLIDRYLGKFPVENSKFQLLGVSAMLIASKYEEIYAPEVRDFVYVTNKCYTKEEILNMEGKILTALDFDILSTSPLRFLERLHFISDNSMINSNNKPEFSEVSMKCFYLAQYLIELSLLEYRMLAYPPSLKAASSLYVARKIFKIDGPNTWTNSLQFHTNYKEKELMSCTKDMCNMLELVSKISLKNLYKKFSSEKFLEISKLVHQKFTAPSDKNGK
jgi:G2/mitotic-specific cyclin-B, other